MPSDIDAIAKGLHAAWHRDSLCRDLDHWEHWKEHAQALAATPPVAALLARAALADELLDLYIRAYCIPEKFWGCIFPPCVEARERLPVAALAKWEASK